MTTTPRQAAAWTNLFLLAALAIGLRWDLYPKTYFADELIPRAVVKHMLDSGTLDTNWDHADWRGDFAGGFYDLQQYNFSSYHTTLLRIRQLLQATGMDRLPDLASYRIASLAFQLSALVLVFLSCRQVSGTLGGVLAAAFLVTVPQAVVDAHYARPESFVIMLVAAAVWFALRQRPARHWLFAEGLVWGVAFACKFSFWPMALVSVAARFWRQRDTVIVAVWLAGFCAGIGLSAPYILLDPKGFQHGIRLLLTQYQPDGNHWLPSGAELSAYLAAFFGAPALLILFTPVLARQQSIRCFAFYAQGITLFYLLVFARQGVFFERNLSHLLPLWAMLFGCGCLTTCSAVNQHWRGMVASVLAVACLAWPLFLSWQINETLFRHPVALNDRLSVTEAPLMAAHPGSKIMALPLMIDIRKLDEIPDDVLLRVAEQKVSGMAVVRAELSRQGYREVAAVDMPLGYLPYNQLQINHLPPRIAYYTRSHAIAGEPAQ